MHSANSPITINGSLLNFDARHIEGRDVVGSVDDPTMLTAEVIRTGLERVIPGFLGNKRRRLL